MSQGVKDLRIALLGQGFMGKAHSNAISQVSRFFDVPFRLRLKVLCGQDSARLASSAAQWGFEETTTDWRTVLERSDIDLIDIGLPNHLHPEIAIAAAEAGKIILCEKPLANTLEDARAMAWAARKVPTLVWFNYRRIPAVAYAKQMIDAGELGDVFHYRSAYHQQWGADKSRPPGWRMDPEQAGHGVISDLLSHIVDVGLYLNGAIEQVSAFTRIIAAGRKVEDAALSLVQFVNGSAGTMEATRFAIGAINRKTFEIQAEKGSLRYNLEDFNKLEYFNAADAVPLQGVRTIIVTDPQHPYGRNFWRPGHLIGYEHTFIATLADFLLSLAKEREFHPNFEDGVRVQEVLDAAIRSSKSRKWEVV